MSKAVNYIIRNLQPKDFEDVRQMWCEAKFTIYTFANELIFKADPEAIVVAEDRQTGRAIGVCSGFNISPELAFIGEYVVFQEYRRLGVGSALWRAVMAHIGTERNISLIADPPMYDKYKNEGFGCDPNRSVHYFKGKPDFSQLTDNIEGVSVTQLNEDIVEHVIEYDRQICGGFDRRVYIEEMARNAVNKTAVAVNRSNQVIGYTILCPAVNRDFRIEPLYADNQSVAELLVLKCCQSLTESETNRIIYRSWDDHKLSLEIADKLGLRYWKRAHLLFTKKVVLGDQNRMFSPSSSTFYPF